MSAYPEILSATDEARSESRSDEYNQPSSWKQYVDHVVDGGDLGTWVSKGKTEGIFEGVPAGLDFIMAEECRLGDDGNTILNSHIWRTTDGRVLSTGTGVEYWDTTSGTLKSSYSGFVTDKPFTGNSTLLGINFFTGVERWQYVELSSGKTTEYLVEHQRTGTNERTSIYRKADGSGENRFQSKRANQLESVLARFDIVGTWERIESDGSSNVITHSPALGGRTICGCCSHRKADGTTEELASRVMWWNTGRNTVCFHVVGNTGGSLMGEMVSLSHEDACATMVSRCSGSNANGIPLSITITEVLKGDTLVSTCTDFTVGDRTAKPDWIGVPFIWKRTGRD